jgi:hypothetical protein
MLSMALPVVAASLALAPVAGAATMQPTIYTPTDSTSLQNDVATADTTAGLNIIELSSYAYQPTSPLILSGDIEITGPPTLQAANGVTQDPEINGTQIFNISPAVPMIEIEPGANVLMKGFDVANGGNGEGTGAIEMYGGNLLMDSTTITGSLGSALVMQGGSATLVNSNVLGGTEDGIEQNGAGAASVTLVQDTLAYNGVGAMEGPNISAYNSYFFKNAQGGGGGTCSQLGYAGDTFVGDYSNDTSCGTTGVTVSTALMNRDTYNEEENGGPIYTVGLKPGNPAIGQGLPQYCPVGADSRFFLYTQGSGGTCDVGGYQTTGVEDTSTTGPACTVGSIDESTNPAVASTETVNVTEPAGSIGLGPDAVDDTITNNGTVGYPANGDWFNATDPSFTLDPSYESFGPYPVTATKPVGDVTAGDTKWSFYASDWLGNTTYCN